MPDIIWLLLLLALATLLFYLGYLVYLDLAYVSGPVDRAGMSSEASAPESPPPLSRVTELSQPPFPSHPEPSRRDYMDSRGFTHAPAPCPEQRAVLHIPRLQDAQAYFVTGPAGSGKSTLLKFCYGRVSNEAVIVAPTGVAALNVGGQTIHRLFGFPARLLRLRDPADIPVFAPHSPRRKLLEAIRYVFVDEISMVRVDVLDAMDWALRLNKGAREPFGGARLIAFGDVMQLEPVVASRAEREYIKHTWGSPFFFDARVWAECGLGVVELKKEYRQASDPGFVELLRRLRKGDASAVQRLNERVSRHGGERPGVVILAPRRREVDEINRRRLSELPGREYRYEASVEGRFSEEELPAEKVLIVKRGAQVMLLRNTDEYVNGDIGIVEDGDSESIAVRLRRGQRVVVREAVWEKTEYTWDPEERRIAPKVVGRYRQLPVRLAWALTIHKSQGLTLDRVHVELGRGMFAHGQLYVALSRARTLDGVTLSRAVTEADVIWEPRAVEFQEWCQEGKVWRGRVGAAPDPPAAEG